MYKPMIHPDFLTVHGWQSSTCQYKTGDPNKVAIGDMRLFVHGETPRQPAWYEFHQWMVIPEEYEYIFEIRSVSEHPVLLGREEKIHAAKPERIEAWIRHREDGPAVETRLGEIIYMQYGVMHREGGPSHITPRGVKHWYTRGVPIRSENL